MMDTVLQDMKLTILVDNNTYIDKYYYGEPAVSYYIEPEDKRVLFDTGYSDIVLRNAEKMGIANVKLIAHPDCFLPKYDEDESIGAPYSSDEIQHRIKYCPSKTIYNITENLLFLGEIPRITDFENQKPIGKVLVNGEWVDDYVKDDTALVYKSYKGIFIITGCSHSGICNIVEYAKKVCEENRILGILGGFHLFENDEQLEKTIEYLCSCDVKHVYPCHCVSLLARAKLMEQLSVVETGVGMTVSIPDGTIKL